MRGYFLLVLEGFRCNRCNGTIQKADLAEGLVVVGETYVCVKSYCYLGHTLDKNKMSNICQLCQKQYDLRNLWRLGPC